MSDTNMLKPRFFVTFPTQLFRRNPLVSRRVCFFLVVLASVVLTSSLAPCRLYAQNRPLVPTVDGGNVQTSPASPNRSTQPRGGVPAQINPAQIENAAPTQAPSVQSAGSPSGSDSAAFFSTAPNASTAPNSSDEIESAPRFLAQTNGRYAFLRLAKNREDFAKVRLAPNSQMVVVPRKNFLYADKKNQESAQRSSEESGFTNNLLLSEQPKSNVVNGAVSESPSVKTRGESAEKNDEDYVAFILTDLDSDEGVLLRDARDGRWDSTDLLSASLIAEGLTTPEKRAHYRSVYGRLLATLKPQAARIAEPFQKSEIVYNFLHQTTLTAKYDLNSSSVAKALDTGVFNCVSATVLFNCFARECGLNVAALETTGHAKSRVKFDDSYLDIETTCSDWNRLPDRVRPYSRERKTSGDLNAVAEGGVPAQLDSAPIIRGNVDDGSAQSDEDGSTSFGIDSAAPLGYSFTRTKRPMREITEVELVATIYYNVGVDYYQVGAYERAVASYIKAIQLAPNNQTILGNLKATLNNWAIDLAAKEKRYDAAIQITLFGLALDPDFEEFNANLPVFFRDWVEYLAKDNKWEEIKRVQEESKRILATVRK